MDNSNNQRKIEGKAERYKPAIQFINKSQKI